MKKTLMEILARMIDMGLIGTIAGATIMSIVLLVIMGIKFCLNLPLDFL
jgi:hypothetical protein